MKLTRVYKKKTRTQWMRIYMLAFPLLVVLSAGGNVATLSQTIPRKILDWQALEKDQIYNRKTLFEYMDGGAEIYLAFDFREVFVRKYKSPAGDEIVLDIYDMNSSEEAYGVFSCDRQDPEAGIGQESTFGPGLLRFWQGHSFVSIMAAGDEQKAEKAILELGKAVASRLGPPGVAPPLLHLLPQAGLLKNKTSYFHSSISLNNRYFLASENILGLDRGKTDCVFAEYPEGSEETTKLLLIRYPDESQARAAHQFFLKAFLPDAGPAGTARTENKKWTLARQRQNFLAILFDATSEEQAEHLLSAVKFPFK